MRSIMLVPASALLLALAACGKDSQPVEPQNTQPDAQFVSTCSALRCDFTESSTDSDGSIATWSWNFGDGQSATDQNPFHTYDAAGTYTVGLTVTDNEGATNTESKQVVTTEPAVTSLSCADAQAPGGYVACKLRLEEPSGFKVVLTSSSCTAHGNVFRIIEPVQDTLTTDGCYEPLNQELRFDGPFPTGTDIAAEVIAPLLTNPPGLRVTGAYPEWTLSFEDGGDADFNDLVMTLTALPTP